MLMVIPISARRASQCPLNTTGERPSLVGLKDIVKCEHCDEQLGKLFLVTIKLLVMNRRTSII